MDEYIRYLRELDSYLFDFKQSIKRKDIKVDPDSDLSKVIGALYSFHDLLKSAINDDYKKLPEMRKQIELIIDTINNNQKIKHDLSLIDSGSLEWILGYKSATKAVVDMARDLHSSIEDNLAFYSLLEKANAMSQSLQIETDKLKFEKGLDELAGLVKDINDSSKTTRQESIHKLAGKFHNVTRLLEYDAFILLPVADMLTEDQKKLASASAFFAKFNLGEVSASHEFTQSFVHHQTALIEELKRKGPAKQKATSPTNTGFFGISPTSESVYTKWEPPQPRKRPSKK